MKDEFFSDQNEKLVERVVTPFKSSLHPKCLHQGCDKCQGTGRDKRGNICVHMISCPCPACSPMMQA